jgi:uncharacterized protein YbjT (DUF2867 family)
MTERPEFLDERACIDDVLSFRVQDRRAIVDSHRQGRNTMFTVMGATGRTGSKVAERLLAAGEQVRVVGRSADRLASLVDAGAEAAVGDLADAAFLGEAFHGAEAAYVMFPYDPRVEDFFGGQRRLGAAVAQAAPARVVLLSSMGADLPAGTGFVSSLYEHEQRLAGVPDLLVLRPGSFYENFAELLQMVPDFGMIADAVDADVPVPMVSTRDVAAAAADALLDRSWSGHAIRELRGPRDLSYGEATALLGARIGRPDLTYVRLPDADLIGALQGASFSAATAELHVQLGRAISEGVITPAGQPGSAPTPFEDVADELARDFLAVPR